MKFAIEGGAVNVHLYSRIIDGTFTDVTIDTVTNRAPTWWNDPCVCMYINSSNKVRKLKFD